MDAPGTKPTLRAALAAAVCTLLAPGARAGLPPVETQSAVLIYSEPGRVSAVETVARTSFELAGDRRLGVRLVFDALTGASANGGVPSRLAQTFTRPSGRGSYVVPPGDTPLDDTFHDTRVAGNVDYDTPLGRLARIDLGANVSSEFDYRSIGLSAILSKDLHLRNTTITAGVSGSFDTVNPVGGVPQPFGAMRTAGQQPIRIGDTREKRILDVLAGVTQVIDRSTLMQFNYSYSRSSGYLTDPYKVLSVVGSPSGSRSGQPIGLENDGYRYEKRPDARTKHGLFWEGRHTPGSDVIGLSYRFLWDDWGVRSHTVEGRYRWAAGEHTYLEPQMRYYRQTAADFYRHSLVEGDPLPRHATADYRLGEMDTMTQGVKIGRVLGRSQEAAVRVQYYRQSGNGSPSDAIGDERQFDLFPTVGAWIGQISYNISF